MADNAVLSAAVGVGITVAADDIAGIHYPRSKISLGADGTAVDAGAGAGVVGTDTQRVTLGSDDPAVVALQLIDNAISGAGFNVTQFAGASVPIGAGVEATAVRVTLATDSTGVVSIDDNGASLTVDNAQLSVVGGGAEATALRVTIASDSTGVLSIDDNGGAITVDGTVAATQSGTWNVGTVTTVTTVGAVTAITNALPAGTNTIGAVNIAAAQTLATVTTVGTLSVISAGSNLIGDVGLQPRTSGGLTMHKTTSAASTNATSVKGSAGQVYNVQCFNVNAAVRYLKLYNKATAPTVGTDTPVKTLAIPGNTAGSGFVIGWSQGLEFGTGIAFALTTEATDAGTTAVAVNEITVNIDYK